MEINWLAVIVATIAYFILGGLWFAPFGLGKLWDKAIGFERPEKWKPSSLYYVGPFVGCFVVSLATAILINILSIEGYIYASVLGLVVSAGYATSVSFVNAITPHVPRPLLLGMVTGLYHMVGIILVAIIIVALS